MMHLSSLLFIVIIVLESFDLSESVESNNKKDDKITINTLEDIEILTYFLLWKYNYFQHEELEEQNGIPKKVIKETEFYKFLENLKQNKLVHYDNTSSSSSSSSSVSSSINCNNIDESHTKVWESGISTSKARSLCEAADSCKSSAQLLDLIMYQKADAKQLTITQAVVRLCPFMLFQLHDQKCLEEKTQSLKERNRPSAGSVWGFGILFVTIVSFCSLIGVAIMPMLTKNLYDAIITLFEGLAVGSLVGSAIFHLIPQAFKVVGTDPEHTYLWKASLIFGGIYLFFLSERFMKIIVEMRRKKKLNKMPLPSGTSEDNEEPKIIQRKVCFSDSNPNGYEKSFSAYTDPSKFDTPSPCNSSVPPDHKQSLDHFTNFSDNSVRESVSLSSIGRERSRSNSFTIRHGHSHGDPKGEIATVAWMIIFGDGLHNFIDGLSIGAAFSESILSGISISVAVICEEFPHELGDFAVLIASGMTLRQALGYNFLSACTCYVGLGFGILLGDLNNANSYIFALAGGMFLYIALVDMMGELSSSLDDAYQKSMSHTFKIILLQNIGILLGVSTLLFLAKYSEKINFEGLAPPAQSEMPFTAD